jgi:hypothetical protein
MNKLELMQEFMNTFVGKDFHLLIKEKEDTLQVHTIEIMQKTDETCPVKEISVGDYFLHLIASNQRGNEASVVCDWTEELLQNLLDNYEKAKGVDFSYIKMFKDPVSNDPNRWLLVWGNNNEEQRRKTTPIAWIT